MDCPVIKCAHSLLCWESIQSHLSLTARVTMPVPTSIDFFR